MHALADAMHAAMEASVPARLEPGEWHLPYVNGSDRAELGHNPIEETIPLLIKLSVARCARVSYLTHDGKAPSVGDDLALYDRLVGNAPLHASPAEHQATPDVQLRHAAGFGWRQFHLHGNFTGWVQYRKTLPDESVPDR